MYRALYNMALVMWAALFAGCAYCAALMWLLTEGLMSTLWGAAGLFWMGMLIWYLIDCIPKKRKRKAAKRAGTR